MSGALRRPAPFWFYLLSAGVVLIGALGSAMVAALYATFGFARLWGQQPVEATFAFAAPAVVAILWTWLALRQARRGRLRLGTVLLATVYLLLFVQLMMMGLAR